MNTAKILAIAACLGLVDCVQAQPYMIEVKPGDSIETARNTARALSAAQRANGVEIRLAPGVHRIDATLKLGPQDAGVTWRSADGGRAVICDGMELKPELFKPVPEGKQALSIEIGLHRRIDDIFGGWRRKIWKPQ